MLKPLMQSPYYGFSLRGFVPLSDLRFDTIVKDGRKMSAKIVQPLERADFGNVRADDFSIKVIKEAGMLGTLKECATIKLSPLDAQETVIDAVSAMNDAEFAEKYRLENQVTKVESAPAPSEPQQ